VSLAVRRANDRGHADHGWLDSHHTFSFADYYDPAHMGFRVLRVINEDRVQPGRGFGTHGHQDMEILTWVLEGQLEHKDSMGTGSIIRARDLQYMSAGSGVTHSEFNPSPKELVHFLQIWILPGVRGAKPRYDQRSFGSALKPGELALLASPDGASGSIEVRQDMKLFAGVVDRGVPAAHALGAPRHAWLQVTSGSVKVGDKSLGAGDGLAASGEPKLAMSADARAEFLLFDLP
jgi:redox-sensitive bicupin YhaK (pirin superfamily)